MTTSKELCQLLRRLEKETLTVELKRSDILNNHDGSRDLAYEIVAFANRRGGKLILGVNNDGSFEGKSIFDVDRIKGRIDNICYQQISPIIDYKFNCLELDEGDVIVIDIPKKRGIPHAYIGKREGTEIKNRIYYIRTTHGKRLVSDNQLQWLFGQQEEDFTFDFRTIITHEKNFLNVRFPSMEQPQCLDNYYEVTNCLSSKIARNPIFKQDFAGDSQRTFFLGITPYALIHTLSSYFGDSWVIEVDRRRPYGKSHQIKSNLKGLQLSDIQKVSSSDLPRLSRNALLVNLNEEIINSSIAGHGRYEEPSFCVPSGTTISVEYEDRSISKRAKLVLANKNFEFVFLFEERGIKAGPAHGNPIWGCYCKRI
jgi:hypothetical protein